MLCCSMATANLKRKLRLSVFEFHSFSRSIMLLVLKKCSLASIFFCHIAHRYMPGCCSSTLLTPRSLLSFSSSFLFFPFSPPSFPPFSLSSFLLLPFSLFPLFLPFSLSSLSFLSFSFPFLFPFPPPSFFFLFFSPPFLFFPFPPFPFLPFSLFLFSPLSSFPFFLFSFPPLFPSPSSRAPTEASVSIY